MQESMRMPCLVVVWGPPRSGVSLLASQLARQAHTLLIDPGLEAGLAWLRAWLLQPDAAPPLEALRDAYGGPRIPKQPSWLVFAAHGLLDEPELLKELLHAVQQRGPIRVVRVKRSMEACRASAARFPHLLPHLPSPWLAGEAFAEAYGRLWQRQQQTAQALQAQVHTQIVEYEQLVAAPEPTLARLRGALGWPLEQRGAALRGISESLCFRERPVDGAGIAHPQPQQPAQAEPPEPLLLATGRGGSGTRLLSDLLLGLGVDLGDALNPMGDSIQWADLVYEIALGTLKGHGRACRGAWADLLSQRAAALMGGQCGPWGFKLPELMLMLEPALEAWPNTTIVHLVRHPVDVCLRRTHMTSRLTNPIGRATLEAAYRHLGLQSRPEEDEPWWHNAVSWRYQLELLVAASERYPGRIISLPFEELCEQPQRCAAQLATRLGLQPGPVALGVQQRRRSIGVQPDSEMERMDEIWALCGDLAAAFGYARKGFAVNASDGAAHALMRKRDEMLD